MAKHFLMKIHSLDQTLVLMDNATLWTTLMAVKAPDGKNLLFLVDCSWSENSFSFVFPAKYHIKAQEFVKYLPKYMQHEHSNAAFCWFMPDAIVKAKEMGWDKHLHQPLLQDRIDLKANLKLLNFDWCIPMEKPTKIDLTGDTPVDMDNLSLPSFQTLGNIATIFHLAGPSTKAVDSMKVNSPWQFSSLMTVALDNLTANSTIAT